MTAKQLQGSSAPDSAKYGTLVNGTGSLVTVSTSSLGTPFRKGPAAPDGSIYVCLTTGSGNLT